MGIVSKETGVLKLVRAGGIVERYKHPIKAAQIMERYPRHCVTRPDFFRNPYIVVKPESVLRLGEVFFIVPYHTVYRLLKSKGYHCNHHYTTDHNEAAVNRQTLDQMENVDTSFFQHIVPLENIRNKKPSNRQIGKLSVEVKRDNLVFRDGHYDSDDAFAAAAAAAAGRNGCLKPCLKNNRPNKMCVQQGPRVRFMLPDEDDDEKWDTDFADF